MGPSRESRVYRIRQLPLHLKDRGATESLLASIPPLEAANGIRVFSLAQEKPTCKTATVSFKNIPSIFDNDDEQWTLPVEHLFGQNIIVDTHFRDFTVLNEPQDGHTVDCVAISGLASHPFGSWKHRESGSQFMWLRDRLPQDVPKLRSFIYGYDTKLFRSHSFQDLDDISRSFIASLKEIRRSLVSAKPLILLAHSLGGIVVKRALVLLASESDKEEKLLFKYVRGLVFFGVPHKGMKISHLLAMVTKQPNEHLIAGTLSPDSRILPELDKRFSDIALHMIHNVRVVYETAESQLTEQNPAGTWVRSETYTVLVNKDSAIPPGILARNTRPVNEDHSNMVKFREDDPVYRWVMLFIFDLSNDLNIQKDSHVGQVISVPVQQSVRAFSNVPFPKDPGFVGREGCLAQLESEIAYPKSQRRTSLYGLGGIGKSQIAIEYSFRQKQRSQTSTFWVHASSKSRFEQSFADIAMTVEIPEITEGKISILQLVSNWLSKPANGPWLLILDNADDATVLLDVPKKEDGTIGTFVQRRLYDFIPQVQHGLVLVTTRNRNCALDLMGDYSTPIEVKSMSTIEAIHLARRRIPKATEEELTELVQELEEVPLAISQAIAYINAIEQVTIPMYLTKFRRSTEDQAALLNKDKRDLRRDPEVPNAVITSWELSFDQIRKNLPKSADLLSMMSFLNRQAIPQHFLQEDDEDIDFLELINPLLNFSLVRAEIGNRTFEIHRLVQTAMRHWLRSEGSDQFWKECVVEQVANKFPYSDQLQYWPRCETLMAHADEALLYTSSSRDSDLKRADLLISTAWYLSERRGDYGLAEQRSTSALYIRQKYFDEVSDEITRTLDVLAAAQIGLMKTNEARDLQESILKQSLDRLGPDHGDTLVAMHNLAYSYENLGLLGKAENLLISVIKGKRTFGIENPSFLTSANLLAQVQIKLGNSKEAEEESARVLEISKKCLGIDHPTTLRAMMNLSVALLYQDRLREAENEITSAIPLLTKVYGPSHPPTLDCRRYLAETYRRQEKLKEAEELCESILDTAREVHGLQYQSTLDTMNVLALVYQDIGKFDDALVLLTDTVESSKKVLGEDHLDTLTNMGLLAWCCHKMGNKDHAIELMSKVYEKRREVLPANNPHTTWSAEHLAAWRNERQKIEEWVTDNEEVEAEESEEWDERPTKRRRRAGKRRSGHR